MINNVESPEENTQVIKMVKSFYRFLEKSPTTTTRSNLFEEQFSKDGTSAFDVSSKSMTSLGSSISSKWNPENLKEMNERKKRKSLLTLSVDEKAELIASRSKAAKLEVQLKSLDSDRRRSGIEDDKKRKLLASKVAKDQEEVDVLRRKYKELVEQKQAASDELKSFERSHNEMKLDLHQKIEQLEKENFELKISLEDVHCRVDEDYDTLKDNYQRTRIEYTLCKQRLEEAEKQLKLGKSHVEETKEMISDFNELKSRCHLAEGKVKQLEQRVEKEEEAYLVIQKSQRQLANYRELEKENKRLREDNLLFSESSTNALILEEKLATLKPKVAKVEQLKEKVEELRYENEALLEKLKKWECPGSTVKARSPADFTRIIGDLQVSHLNLTASNTQLETKSRMTDSILEAKQEECFALLKQYQETIARNEQLEDKNQKLQRRLTFLTTERESLRNLLSSYEQEEGTANKIYIEQTEEKVNQYQHQIRTLEGDVAAARKEAVNHKTKYLELNQEYEKLKVTHDISPENIKKIVEDKQMKEELVKLKEKYVQLSEEKDVLELRIEKKEMQGDYDPLKLKVLVLRNNPFQTASNAYQKKLRNTFEENDKMRKKIIKLQSANEELNESMNVSRLIKDSKPMEDALKQVSEYKIKYTRLEEEYSRTAKKYVLAVKNLLGYSLKETEVNTFRLQSIFSESPDDFFLMKFDTKDSGVIGTEFLKKQWNKQFEKYVLDLHSIPLFLAYVNFELGSRKDQSSMYED